MIIIVVNHWNLLITMCTFSQTAYMYWLAYFLYQFYEEDGVIPILLKGKQREISSNFSKNTKCIHDINNHISLLL